MKNTTQPNQTAIDRNLAVMGSDLKLNQRVKRNYPASWVYFVSEMSGQRVLIRTTEDINDPHLVEQWVDLNELRRV